MKTYKNEFTKRNIIDVYAIWLKNITVGYNEIVESFEKYYICESEDYLNLIIKCISIKS